MTALERLGRFAEVPVSVEVELDRRTAPLREILGLAPGVVLPTSQPVGEPLRIYVGGTLLGHGEVVSTGGVIGVRIADFRPAPETASAPGRSD